MSDELLLVFIIDVRNSQAIRSKPVLRLGNHNAALTCALFFAVYIVLFFILNLASVDERAGLSKPLSEVL